jgi:hypothetical protein
MGPGHAMDSLGCPCVRSDAVLPAPTLFSAITEPMRARSELGKSEGDANCIAVNGVRNDSENGINARRAHSFPGVL